MLIVRRKKEGGKKEIGQTKYETAIEAKAIANIKTKKFTT